MNLSLPAFFDILIGLTFIYLILSLLASEIQELIAAFFQFRAKHLKKSIYIMLGGTENSREIEKLLRGLDDKNSDDQAIKLTNELYKNSIIASLTQSTLGFKRPNKKLTDLLYSPSYIPSETFASALVDTLVDILEGEPGVSAENIVPTITSSFKPATQAANTDQTANADQAANAAQIKTIPEKLKVQLYELTKRAELKTKNTNQELKTYQFKKEIEKWYNRSQNRTSGTYKRNTKFVLFWIGLITAGFANANAFHIINSLYHQGTVRNAVTQAAVNAVNDCRNKEDDQKQECLNGFKSNIEETDKLPIGWNFSSPSTANSTNSDSQTTSSTANSTNSDSQTTSSTANSTNTNSQTTSSTPNSLEQIKFRLVQLRDLAIHLLGWVVSAFAIMMGAPFWFDLLNNPLLSLSENFCHF